MGLHSQIGHYSSWNEPKRPIRPLVGCDHLRPVYRSSSLDHKFSLRRSAGRSPSCLDSHRRETLPLRPQGAPCSSRRVLHEYSRWTSSLFVSVGDLATKSGGSSKANSIRPHHRCGRLEVICRYLIESARLSQSGAQAVAIEQGYDARYAVS